MASRSRLPVPHSPPDRLQVPLTRSLVFAASASNPPPIATSSRPQPVRASARNGVSAAAPVRAAKQPAAGPYDRPPLATNNSQSSLGRGRRAGSAPPMKVRQVVGISNGRRTPEPGSSKNITKRTVSSSGTFEPVAEEGYHHFAGSTDGMASIMDAEKATQSNLKATDGLMVNAAKQIATSGMRRGMIAAADELADLRIRHEKEIAELRTDNARKDKELDEAHSALRELSDDIAGERDRSRSLKDALAEKHNNEVLLHAKISALEARCESLATEGQNQVASRSQLMLDIKSRDERIAEMAEELQEAESLRRKLHNQIQELKGNIRVFCRVRPPLAHENKAPDNIAALNFPDKREHKEIVVSNTTESATGMTRDTTMPFSFDRVFEPGTSQSEVFEEISHLAQSCIDGYNVCIFAYGQTGSGKSFTMEGGQTEDTRGMIPRAVRHVFDVSTRLRQKGWSYKMEGQFLEIYNESIVDLLGKEKDGKHDIKHDKSGRTSVTDVVVYPLQNPNQVQNLLSLAQSKRTVHATLMNERSSRSHSVFTLRILGRNEATGETSEGSLNLVDLAGSERLKESGALSDKDRLKETQAINKSLSALGDVIAALGEKGSGAGEKHIPYRNSKLTYLLQNSLSGNSKTLMFVNVSPLAAHLGESICSLRFATKVNNTTLGTARKQQTRPS